MDTRPSDDHLRLPDPIPDPLVELLANRLRVIGDPTRIRMLDRLRHGPASVQELVDAASTSQQNVSKHMTRLMEHGFIARERHGNEHRYRLIDSSPLQVLDLLSADLAAQLRRLADMIGHSE
jgi:DNA-binding transcriptional ArsR family regulator